MAPKEKQEKKPTCGIIMPISETDDCSAGHWIDVLGILKDVCTQNEFKPYLVSDSDDVGVIHNRIVENIYSSDIVICDVSCKNANVMFELGMRLAFDKPTIIIKDDITGYSFDTSLIEHLEYPRDLRFTTIIQFKEDLGKKLVGTHKKAVEDPNYSTFLKNFGKYKIAHLEDKEVSTDTYILNAIEELKKDVRLMRNQSIHENDSEISRLIKRRTHFDKDISEKERAVFRQHVKQYIDEHQISRRPKELSMMLPEIIDELEKNSQLRDIAGTPSNFRKLVEEFSLK